MSYKLPIRPRRNRVNSSIRSLVQENQVTVDDLIMPLFVIEGEGQKQIKIQNSSGWTKIGALNTSYTYYYTDRPSNYFD